MAASETIEKPSQGFSSLVAEYLETLGPEKAAQRSDILFNNLSVIGAGHGVHEAPTIATGLLNALNPRAYLPNRNPHTRTLLHSFQGTINPGEMVLVIGKPGSGATTFLKTLAGFHDEYHDTQGTLLYGGFPNKPGSSTSVRLSYCGEEDEHLPTLNVGETLRFAVQSSWPASTSSQQITTAVQRLAHLVGLSHTLQTKVGNAAVRGVSGGERRRVSLAEALASHPDVLCIDNPTNGLDSSTAIEFIQMISQVTQQSKCATIMSVYQGSEAMIPYFDKVLVLNQGRQVYWGPVQEAKPYFQSLGYLSLDRITTTDFLTSMSADPLLRHIQPGRERSTPKLVQDLAKAFRESSHAAEVARQVEAYHASYQGINEKAHLSTLRRRANIAIPFHRQVYYGALRQYRYLVTNLQDTLSEALILLIQSVVFGSIFYKQSHVSGDMFIYYASIFFLMIIPLLQSLPEFAMIFRFRSLVIKQRDYQFYRPIAFSFGVMIPELLWKPLLIFCNVPQYFMTGHNPNAGRFFTWFINMYSQYMAFIAIFRFLAVLSPNPNTAFVRIIFLAIACVIYSGFYISIASMKVWLGWFRYVNPFFFSVESAVANEFKDTRYLCSPENSIPQGPGISWEHRVCAIGGGIPGQDYVEGNEYVKVQWGYNVDHIWRNIGINFAFMIFFAICAGIGMEFYKNSAGKLSTVYYRTLKRLPGTSQANGSFTSSCNEKQAHSSSASSDTEVGKTPSSDEAPPVDPFRPTTDAQAIIQRMKTHQGRSLAWKNVTLDVTVGKKSKRLLQGVSGYLRHGQLTALMGVSGAGKTTLLNTLAGRIEEGTVGGEFFMDGKPLPKNFRQFMGYVQQQDVHLWTQTVREALQLAAQVRRSNSISMEEKMSYVEDVIDMLDIRDIADALIGSPGSGLNFEQRKRVSIGVELATHPGVLFLDEPTSGLDGQSALKIVSMLRKLANSGQTIFCTIHQPAFEVISHFDELLLLVRGGSIAYDGPMGLHCQAVLDYFAAKGAVECPPRNNPAEYFLDTVGAGSQATETRDWADVWQGSDEAIERRKTLDILLQQGEQPPSTFSTSNNRFIVPITSQFRAVFLRTLLYDWRNPGFFLSKLYVNISLALLCGLTYLNSDNSLQGMYNQIFAMFVAIVMGPTWGVQTETRIESIRSSFLLRERNSFHWIVFQTAMVAAELPYIVITTAVYWVLWYYMVGYNTDPSRAGYAFVIYQIYSIFVHSLGNLLSAFMPSLDAVYNSNGFILTFINVMGGTLIPRPQASKGWRWYFQLNPIFYITESFDVNILHGVEVQCRDSEAYSFIPPANQTCLEFAGDWAKTSAGYLMNPDGTDLCSFCPYRDGDAYLEPYEFRFGNRGRDIGIAIGFLLFNYTAAAFFLYFFKVRKNKN